MPLTIVDEATWEHAEDEAAFVNQASASFLPVSDGVVAAGASDDGAFCKEIELGSSDQWGNTPSSPVDTFARGTLATPVLVQACINWTNLNQMNTGGLNNQLFVLTGATSTRGLVAARIGLDGSISVGGGPGSLTGSFAVTYGSAPAGTIAEGAFNIITLRVVFDNSAGEVQLRVNGVTVVDVTGVDTFQGFGSATTGTGWGFSFQSAAVVSANPVIRISNWTLALDDDIDNMDEFRYVGILPDGVTADNDGTIFGGAGSANEALDERPGTDTDGVTLDAAADAQGLTFPDPGVTGINGILVYGQVGDDASGSEQARCDVGDGVATDTGDVFGVTNDFNARLLTRVESPPGAASWDAAAADLTATLVRTV